MTQNINKRPTRNSWRSAIQGNVLMMGLVSLFTDISSEMIYPLLPLFLTGLVPAGTAAIYIGIMEGVSESAANLIKIFSGRLSDAIEKRKLLAILGYGISTIFRPCMALAGAGWQVIGLRFADRLGKGVRTAPRDALISDSADPTVRGLAFSFHRAMDHAGAALGPVAAMLFLYAFLGSSFWKEDGVADTQEMRALRWLFGITLIPGLAAMATLILKVREITPSRQKSRNSEPDKTTAKSMLFRRFYLFLGILVLFTLGNSSDLFLVLYGKTMFQLDLFHLILLWVALHLSKIVFSLPGGGLSDRYGRRTAIVIGWIIYTLVYLGMAVVTTAGVFWLLILCYGGYYGMTEGAEKALVADFVPVEYRGQAYGLYHGAVGLATLPASILFGVFWAKLSPQWAFLIGACLASAATGLLIILLSTQAKYQK